MTDRLSGNTPDLGFTRALLIISTFFAARVTLFIVREPFFDELFTLWMARHPFSGIVGRLLHDSGPPLYYFIARIDSVAALRALSLVFATAQIVAILAWRQLGAIRWLAAMLLAVYPPAVLFSVDARAYALCALFVTLGVLLLDDERRVPASLAFVIAAYSHYYGVLFFPLLLLRMRSGEKQPTWRVRLLAFALAVVLFVPGFLLASRQPAAATKWMSESPMAPLTNLSMAGMYPSGLFTRPPLALIIFCLALLIVSVLYSTRFAAAVVLPIALAMAVQFAGRPVYLPMRFESVIAGPLVLWIGSSLVAWRSRWSYAVNALLIGCGIAVLYLGVVDHSRRPLDPYRQAAIVLTENAKQGETVVASGYCWLETAVALRRDPIAYPPEQAVHPGWRATMPVDPRQLPVAPFLWIGERTAREFASVERSRRAALLFANDRVAVLSVDGR